MPITGNYINADQRQLDQNQTNPLSVIADIIYKRNEEQRIAQVEAQKEAQKQQRMMDLYNTVMKQNRRDEITKAGGIQENPDLQGTSMMKPTIKMDMMKGDLDVSFSPVADDLPDLQKETASKGGRIFQNRQEQLAELSRVAMEEANRKNTKESPSMQIRKDKRTEDLLTTIEANKPKKALLTEAEDAVDRISSGIYGKIGRGWSKNLSPDSPALGDYQKIKMVLLDAQLANVAFTKGAISNAEMELFGQAAANDELMSSPRMKVVFKKLNRFLKAEEKGKISSYNKIYGEDPSQWEELQGVDYNWEDDKGENQASSGGDVNNAGNGEFMEGQTATNPNTKERIIFRGGKWQSL